MFEQLRDVPKEILSGLGLKDAMHQYKSVKSVSERELKAMQPGTWVVVKWFGEPQEVLLFVERTGYHPQDLRLIRPSTGSLLTVSSSQIVNILSVAKTPKFVPLSKREVA